MGGEGAVYATAEARTPLHVSVDTVTPVDTTVSIEDILAIHYC